AQYSRCSRLLWVVSRGVLRTTRPSVEKKVSHPIHVPSDLAWPQTRTAKTRPSSVRKGSLNARISTGSPITSVDSASALATVGAIDTTAVSLSIGSPALHEDDRCLQGAGRRILAVLRHSDGQAHARGGRRGADAGRGRAYRGRDDARADHDSSRPVHAGRRGA